MSFACRYPWLFSLATLSTLPIAACNSGPSAVKQPYIEASAAGKKAMEMYDKNGDGIVSGPELEQAPGLKAALSTLDSNGDKGVSADEVAARVNAWKAMKTGLTYVRCRVTLDGEPLAGATITFEPEVFLGDEIKPAIAVTTANGEAMPTIRPEDRPTPRDPGGIQIGLYKVRVSRIENGKETIPARYNTNTTLGQEVSYDDPAIKSRNMVFALKNGK